MENNYLLFCNYFSREIMNNTKSTTVKPNRIDAYGTAFSFLLFPLLFVAAQFMHPDVFHLEVMTNGHEWLEHFRGESLLHLAHLLEFICAPLLVIMALHFKVVLREKSPVLSYVGVCMAFIGALMLLGNKSALCLTISAFDTLSDTQILQIVPALDVMLRKESYMFVLWLLPLLPLGYGLIGITLFKTRHVPRWQALLVTIGSLMLANPEIEVINFFASFVLAGGLIPYSIRLLKQA